MRLPDFHDAYIAGLCLRQDDLVITLKLDYTLWNAKTKRELFTFYLENCKKVRYWYKHIKKYDFDGICYRGHRYPSPGIEEIKIKRNELVIYPHIIRKSTKKEIKSYKEWGIDHLLGEFNTAHGQLGKGLLPNPPQLKKKRIIRIKFEKVITT
jgi:hypothetical protein